MPLGWSIAPRQGEACFHRLIIFHQSLGKGAQLDHSACLDLSKPLIEPLAVAGADHLTKRLDLVVGLLQSGIGSTQPGQVRSLPRGALVLFGGE